MIKTAVKWNDIHTEEQHSMFTAKAIEIYSKYPGVVQPDWTVELLGTMNFPSLRIIYRLWPDVAAAQEWIDFLNSANLVHLESAIIVTE